MLSHKTFITKDKGNFFAKPTRFEHAAGTANMTDCKIQETTRFP